MPKFHVVIANAKLAHQREEHRTLEHYVGLHGEAERAQIRRLVHERFSGRPRAAGTRHATAVDTECPDGQPNCRNCGDPAHEATCRAAGHCVLCGRLASWHTPQPDQLSAPLTPYGAPQAGHGLAPDAIVTANGYRLVPATDES